ncbi:MAG: bifunctional glutamine synthetase adenylyltransferase/deadenyltransferase, partial [Pseudomonadota bacterium]
MDLNSASAADPGPGAPDMLARASDFSRYVRLLLAGESDLSACVELDRTWDAERMRARLTRLSTDGASLERALRRVRKEVMLALIARDLSGLADLQEVVATSTALAQTAIDAAVDGLHSALAQQYGEPRGEESGAPQKLHVVGMGKLGGSELNVSSDIDLILLYPEEG